MTIRIEQLMLETPTKIFMRSQRKSPFRDLGLKEIPHPETNHIVILPQVAARAVSR